MAGQRADIAVVAQGLAESRTRAQRLILAGVVLDQNGHRINKPGQSIDASVELRLKAQPLPYVSRGGLKLEHALNHFSVAVAGRTCLDIGASTGGFTDCLLQRGASQVCAVDVGYNQLAWSLRQDSRVVVLERSNIRSLKQLPIAVGPVLVVVVDVSFISLKTVVPHGLRLCDPGAVFIGLVKPQFEVGRGKVGKGGIVRDASHRQECLAEIVASFTQLGFHDLGTTDSPITGAKGNREFLLHARAPDSAPTPRPVERADLSR